MYHVIERKLQCSKCGGSVTESFQRADREGIRCLHCGHEKINWDLNKERSAQASATNILRSWSNRARDVEEF